MRTILPQEFEEQRERHSAILAEDARIETFRAKQHDRRDIVRLTLASVVGLMFARPDKALAQARGPILAGGWFSGSSVGPAGWTFLPSGVAARFMTSRLLTNPKFQSYHKYFTAQGYDFIPERVQLATDMTGLGPLQSDPARMPVRLLAIVPSFRKFTTRDPSHKAVSITATIAGENIVVSAAVATVNHRPFSISSFEIVEIDEARVSKHTVDARQLMTASPEEIVRKIGAPISRPAPFRRNEVEMDRVETRGSPVAPELAAIAYDNILTDRFARPLYPAGAVDLLLAETPLVQRFAEVGRAFYSQIGSPTTATTWCCCLCCCCNGSCSCCAL